MLNIVHVIPSLATSTGGPAFLLASLASAQSEAGHSVSIISTDSSGPANSRGSEVPVTASDLPLITTSVHVILCRQKFLRQWSYSPEITSALRQTLPSSDLLHIHSVNLHPQFAAFRVATALHVPYIVSPHGALDAYVADRRKYAKQVLGLLWQDRMLSAARGLHATSEKERLRLLVRNENVTVVPSGISDLFFHNSGEQRPIGRQADKPPLVINHGRISRKKGLERLVAALPYCSNPHTFLRLIGPDDEGVGSSLRKLAGDLGVSHRFEIVPALHGYALCQSLSEADVWCLPSHAENFGLAIVEAMALGLAVIVSPEVDIGSDAERIGAAVVSPTEPLELAKSIDSIIEDDTLGLRLGRTARAYAAAYRWQDIEPRMTSLYLKALSR